MIEIFDFDQSSPEWFEARRGLPTASMFSAILAKGEGKTRKSYLHRLAAEIVTGDPGEAFTSPVLERGKIMEAEARALYEFLSEEPVRQVGFIRNCFVGASPDSLVGEKGGLEIKTQRADLLVETLLKDQVPTEHIAQVQGNLWVSEREWWDLVVFWPRMPLFKKRVYRDEAYIKNLGAEVSRFREELLETVWKVKALA